MPRTIRDLSGLRVVAVHAHPDDEALWTGGALAQLSRRGAQCTVVTATLGEEGEVIGETYQGLTAKHADCLGGFRIGELHASLSALGVQGRFLGEVGRYRDSGMAGSAPAKNPQAFINSGERAVADLAALFEEIRPQLVLTYAPDGGYGHPDHIFAHKITHAAAKKVPVQRIAWSLTDEADLTAGLRAITRVPQGWHAAVDGDLSSRTDAEITLTLTDADISAKAHAMQAHASQIWMADGYTSVTNPHAARAEISDPQAVPYVFALSNLIAQPLLATESYRIGSGQPVGPHGESSDLTEGLQW